MFVPLHATSDYSLGWGTASVDDLVDRAAALGYRALALTDIENLYGQVGFHARCRARGLRAVTGVELRPDFVSRRRPGGSSGRLLLLAADRRGYANLCRIVTRRRAGRGGRRKAPGDPVASLARRTEGLFALSDDEAVLSKLKAQGLMPADRLGLLVVRPGAGPPAAVWRASADRLGISLVADLDAVLLSPADHALHRLQMAVHQGVEVKDLTGAHGAASPERWLRSPQASAALFSDLPEAVAANQWIADQCRFELGAAAFGRSARPSAPEAGEKLRGHCHAAVARRLDRGQPWTPAHRERLARELALFEALGFADLMLIVADVLAFCVERGIPAVARGSAVSAVSLYLLGGSMVDPVEEGLLLERFLHAGKSEWPDVDIDLPWHRREEVISWVLRRYGRGRAAPLSAHHRFQHRSALREGLKAMGVPPAGIRRVLAGLPPEDLEPAEMDFMDLAERLPAGTEDAPPVPPGSLQRILPLVQRLVGRPRHVATHPGGIVFADRLEDRIPLERVPSGRSTAQYDLSAVAALGWFKIDFLGNRCLSELEETLQLAGHAGGLAGIPAEDAETLTLVDRAATLGCFQLESPAMRSLLTMLPVRRASDLTAALALIRPGAAAGAAKTAFVRRARARGREPVADAAPEIADRLGETYGLLLYEEDIMLLLSRAGGIDPAMADELRAAIIRSGGNVQALSRLEAAYLKAAGRQGAMRPPPERARRAWAAATRLAAYAFNKAHAASYARLAYLSAYTKTHYPVPFACALLNHHRGLYPLRTLAAELDRMGIAIRAPHVNHSDAACRLEPADSEAGSRAVRVGFNKVKGFSMRAARDLLEARAAHGAFASLRDLLERVRLSARERRALVRCGACDGLRPIEPGVFPIMHMQVLEFLASGGAAADLDMLPAPALPPPDDRFRRYQALVRIQHELTILEMHLSAHPAAVLRTEAETWGCVPIRAALAWPAGKPLRLLALAAAMRRVRTATGVLQFVTLEDETGIMEAAVLPPVYRRLSDRVTTPGPFLVEGTVRRRMAAPYLEITGIEPFHRRHAARI